MQRLKESPKVKNDIQLTIILLCSDFQKRTAETLWVYGLVSPPVQVMEMPILLRYGHLHINLDIGLYPFGVCFEEV